LLGRGATDSEGHFRLDAARTSSDGFFEVDALAAAPGFGLGWVALNPDAEQPAAEIRLRPEQVIHGRLVDVNGQPAAGVELRVYNVGHATPIGTFDGIILGDSQPPEGLRAWPKPVTTDRRGRFTLGGIGPDLGVALGTRDLRFARQWLHVEVESRAGSSATEVTLALQPATIIEGRALAADTGRPLPNAAITVAASRDEFGSMYTTRFLADDRGRFTLNPSPGRYFRVSAFPPEGQPYLVPHLGFAWAKGTVRKVMDLPLPRGVLIRGTVTEQGTGRPLGGASVQYIPVKNRDDVLHGWQAVVASHVDGSFQIVVEPGKGHLFIYGPTSDYILEAIGDRTLYRGEPGGTRYYAHRIVAYDVKAGDPPRTLTAALRPGQTVRGRVVGPEGQPVEKAAIITTLHFNYFHLNWRGDITLDARDGRFELRGLDPEKAARVSFLDADHQWGAAVELSGRQAGQEVTIQLQPCGQAKARFVGLDGKPLAKYFPHFEILGTPGPHEHDLRPESKPMLAADAAYIVNLDRKHYWNSRFTDAEGRITLPNLIPGASYRISDSSTVNVPDKGVQVRRDFTVKLGETLDLGEILIEKPSA
jgi:hypothetical protein